VLVLWLLAILAGTAAIVWGAERFAENLSAAAIGLGVSAFALALLLAGAEPEELATTVTASARHAPGIAFGDVIGANVAVCLVALGVGAVVAPMPFGARVRTYAWLGVPITAVAVLVMWDGRVGRLEGGLLVLLYVGFVGAIWIRERQPPTLGEAAELTEAHGNPSSDRRRISAELAAVGIDVLAIIGGAVLLVEAVRQLTGIEETQTKLALTVVGFATAFELVVLAWSIGRRGASEATVAAVVGSVAYNATMTLGAAALVRPLSLAEAEDLRPALLAMLAAMVLVSALGSRGGHLDRRAGWLLLGLYPVFVALVVIT
jgi:cation:H+ antiporter